MEACRNIFIKFNCKFSIKEPITHLTFSLDFKLKYNYLIICQRPVPTAFNRLEQACHTNAIPEFSN